MSKKEKPLKLRKPTIDSILANMKILKPILISLLFALALSSCMVGPKLEKPVVDSEEQFRFDSIAGDSMLNLAWWDMFADPILDSMIYTALEHNQDVLIAMSRIEQAYAVLGVSKADLWPQFGYDVSGSYGEPSTAGSGSGAGGHVNITPNVYWELDFWGKVRRSNQAARAEIAASEEALRMVQIGIITAVADGYFQLLDYDQRLEIARRTWDTRKESLWIIDQCFQQGTVPELDLNQAQQQEAIAATAIPVYERAVARTENYLSILLGQNPRNLERGRLDEQVFLLDIPVGLPSELLQRRPDLVQAEQYFYAETARIGVMQAMRFPSFSITAAAGVASSELSSLFSTEALMYSVGGSILGPIFNWGKNKRRVEIQKETARQALLRYEQAVLNAFREVDDALIDVETYEREVESTERQRKAASNAARLSRARYDGGQTAYLEVLDTERSLFNAELDNSAVKGALLSSYIYLYKALGGGWITPEEEAAAEEAASEETP
jgi:multidrug efflux system outer membrane protein